MFDKVMPNNSFIEFSEQPIDDCQVDKTLVRHERNARCLAYDASDRPVFIETLNSTSEQDPELDGRFHQQMHTLMQHSHPDKATILYEEGYNAETVHARTARLSRWLHAVVFLGLLLMVLSACTLAGGNSETNTAASLTATAGVAAPTIAPLFQTQEPEPTVTLTATDMPQILPLNPPPEVIFTGDEIIEFEWYYPIPLTSDQQFSLQFQTRTGLQMLGTVTTSLSGRYRFTVDLADWELISGLHRWFVVLETISGSEELLRSIPQPFTIQADVFVGPRTSTPTLTLTPEISGVQPMLTPTVVCTPAPPSGWVVYTVVDGDYLFNLALATNTTVEQLQAVNCLTTPGLGIGKRLWLPALPPTPTPTSIPTAVPTTSSSGGDSKPTGPEATKTPPPPPPGS
jgi:LysM repeat protein